MLGMENLVIPFVVSSVVTPLMFYWLMRLSRRHRLRRDARTGACILEYSRAWRGAAIVFLVGAALLVSIPAVLIGPREPGDPYIIAGLALFFIGSGTAGIIETFGARVLVSSEGLESRSPWSRPRRIRWTDVRAVTYNPFMHWIAVSGDGKVIRIGEYMSGLDVFETFMRDRLPPDRYAGWPDAQRDP